MEQHKQDGYIKSERFIAAAHKYDYNENLIAEHFKELGYNPNPRDIRQRIRRMSSTGKLKLKSGNSPELGMLLKKASTMYGPNGEIKLQWVQSETSKEDILESFSQAIQNLSNTIAPAKMTTAPVDTLDSLMSIYTIGDAHVGMLAWSKESGEDNDLETAQSRHISAMSMLVDQATPSKEAFIIDVGDYFHADNSDNRTSKSGNSLDVDGRYAKVLEIGLRLSTTLIDLALQKHQTVRWRSAIGE